MNGPIDDLHTIDGVDDAEMGPETGDESAVAGEAQSPAPVTASPRSTRDATPTRKRHTKGLVLPLIALIAATSFLVIVLVIASRGGETAIDTVASPTAAATVTPAATPEPVSTTAPIAEPTAVVVSTPTPIPIPSPTPEFGPTGRPTSAGPVWVLTATSEIRRPTVYDAPDGTAIPVTYTYLDGRVDSTYDHFTNPTYFGNSLALMVIDGERGDEWVEVQIPTRPIMRGWVRTDGWEWSKSDYYVRVNIGNNTIKVWRGDVLIVDDESVVTGDSGRETPIASTFIDEIMPGPSSAYGPWLMSLGLFSDAINTFGSAGGLPKVALHGTNRPDLLGQYASNGCIRLPNDVIAMLADEVPVGTRVDIVRET